MKISNSQIDFYIQKIAQEKIAGCLLFGPESTLASYRFDLIAKKISPDLSDQFLVTRLGKDRLNDDKGVLADEFFSYSMFGGRKLILVKDADLACAAALKIIFETKDLIKKCDNFILIQAGDLDKSSSLRKSCEDSPYFAAIACYEDDERVIKKFIIDEFARRGVRFEGDVAKILFEKFGKSRQLILSELEKICIFLDAKKTLTPELVEKLVMSESEISVNDFIMNFASQKFDLALKQSEKLFRDGFEVIALIRFLSNYLWKLYQAKVQIEIEKMEFENAVKEQRLFFKVESEFRAHLKKLSLGFLVKVLQDLVEIEAKIKNGKMLPRLVFAEFVSYYLINK